MGTESRSLALAWVTAAGILLALPGAAAALSAAETRTPRGLAAELRGSDETQRVTIELLDQPVLRAAADPPFRALVAPPVPPVGADAARRSPLAVTAVERRAAARNEQRYDRAVAGLAGESREARGTQAPVVAAVRRLGGTVLDRTVLPNAILARLEPEMLRPLARRPDVQAIVAAPRERKHLNVSTDSIGATHWWDAGFTGGEGEADVASTDAGMVGDAPDPAHPAFTPGVTIDNDPNRPPSDHGTHVSGVVASSDTTYRGVAHGLETLIGASTEAYALGIEDGGTAGASDPAEVLNLSAGSVATSDDENRFEDLIVDLFGVGYAASAGNENPGGPDPPPTINNIGHNMLSVAASNDLNSPSPGDDVVLGDSSRGPTPGGRKKPDLIAPGAGIVSPSGLWNSPPANPDYTPVNGTSFAAPHVTGALALLAGAGISDPKTQRAILINSARDWGSQTHWQPDVGWGALDLGKALADRGDIAEGSVEGGGARFFAATVASGAKTTLAWNLRGIWPDFPATSPPPTTYTTTNLDLRSYDGSTYSELLPPADPGHGGGPDALDSNDTIEQVRAPGAGEVIFKVKAASAVEGATSEPFSLASESPLVPLVAPAAEPTGTTALPSGPVNCSTDVVISTSVVNPSPDLPAGSPAGPAQVAIELPAGVELLAGAPTQTVSGGTLAPDAEAGHSWTVRATGDGVKEIVVTGSGSTLDEPFSTSESLSLTADCTPPKTTISGPSGPTNQPAPSFSFAAPGAVGFECALDSGPFAACTSPYRPGTLAAGAHTVRIRATDAAGNVEPVPATRTVVVDTTAPASAITSGPEGPTRDPRPRFVFGANEARARTECRLDGGAFAPCSSPFGFPRLADGRHIFSVRAIDPAGNVEPQPATRDFVVDTRIAGAKLAGKGTQRQRRGKVKIKVEVAAAEALRVRVLGSIRIPGRNAKVRTRTVALEAGTPAKLTLKPRKRRDRRRVLRAIAKGRPAGAELEAYFTDPAGNTTKPSIGIRLR